MILYLSSNEHTNLLDFLKWDKEGDSYTIKNMVGNFVLKNFVVYDMRNFSHCTEIVLDRIAFRDTDFEFVEAIKDFLMMYHARITVICEGLKPEDNLLKELLNNGIGNLVTGDEIKAMQEEIRECFSTVGMLRYQSKETPIFKKEREEYQFTCENVKIVCISSVSRMGVTTTAIGMTSWLAAVGAEADYVEANQSGHILSIVKVYKPEQTEERYYIDGAGYHIKVPEKRGNFLLYDVGREYQTRMEIVNQADILVLVCGAKPYELAETMGLCREFANRKAFIVFPFADKRNQDNIREAFKTEFHQVLFMEYQPDFFDGSANAETFKKIIEEYIAGA